MRYLSPEIDREPLGIDEHWREEIKIVFRKRPVRKPLPENSFHRREAERAEKT